MKLCARKPEKASRATKVQAWPPRQLLAIHRLTGDTPLFSLEADGCVTFPVPLLHASEVH